jgi:hypothetical protein
MESLMQDYLVVVCAMAVAIGWFTLRSFYFLDFEFDPLPMSLRHVTKHIERDMPVGGLKTYWYEALRHAGMRP